MRIALISCAKEKRGGCHSARDIYTSPLFQYALHHTLDRFDKVFILSAKHGLLDLDRRIRCYDVTLNSMSAEERREWARKVVRQICRKTVADDEVHFFCGQRYREFLVGELGGRGVFAPLYGLGIGQQLQWYKNQP